MSEYQCRIPITTVKPGSIAHELGILPGDFLLTINGRCPQDIIDFRYLEAEEELTLLIESSSELIEMEIEKDVSEDLGIIFDLKAFSPIRSCENQCIFCFVDQLPAGMRSSLYIKDDDYRYSVVSGNFITLSNLTMEDRDRIIREKLSPLHISVHALDPEVRTAMMRNARAGQLLEDMEAFAREKLSMHTQIVLCPEWNDGVFLDDTLQKLGSLFPSVQSIGVVPLGLTGHRQGLVPLRAVDSKKAEEVIDQIDRWRKQFLAQLGYPLVFAADEFFSMAKRPLPDREYYADFPQTENGIGLLRLLLDRWHSEKLNLPKECASKRLTIVTGVSSARYVEEIITDLNCISGLDVQLQVVHSHFFGGGITVTGLITGKDLLDKLHGQDLGDAVLIPDSMLQDELDRFLDDTLLTEAADLLQTELVTVNALGIGLVEQIRNLCMNRKEV